MFHNRDVFQRVPLFKKCPPSLARSLVAHLEPLVCCPGEVIIYQGDIGREMYFLSRGMVIVSIDGEEVDRMASGSFFGEMSLLYSQRRTAEVKAASYCDLYKLSKATFDAVTNDFPDFRNALLHTASKRMAQLRVRSSPEIQVNKSTGKIGWISRVQSDCTAPPKRSLHEMDSDDSGSASE